MAQASAWIQEEVECLEGQVAELEEEIRGIEEKMRAEEAAEGEVAGGRVFASRRGFAYQLGKARREEERRRSATEDARRSAEGCREHIGAGRKRQRSIEVAAKIKELNANVGRCLQIAAEEQKKAAEYRREMESLLEEQERAVQTFGVEWARLLEEVREATEERGESREDMSKGGANDEWAVERAGERKGLESAGSSVVFG